MQESVQQPIKICCMFIKSSDLKIYDVVLMLFAMKIHSVSTINICMYFFLKKHIKYQKLSKLFATSSASFNNLKLSKDICIKRANEGLILVRLCLNQYVLSYLRGLTWQLLKYFWMNNHSTALTNILFPFSQSVLGCLYACTQNNYDLVFLFIMRHLLYINTSAFDLQFRNELIDEGVLYHVSI
jgi:hypothetical protein